MSPHSGVVDHCWQQEFSPILVRFQSVTLGHRHVTVQSGATFQNVQVYKKMTEATSHVAEKLNWLPLCHTNGHMFGKRWFRYC